jgi:hypothetical protein
MEQFRAPDLARLKAIMARPVIVDLRNVQFFSSVGSSRKSEDGNKGLRLNNLVTIFRDVSSLAEFNLQYARALQNSSEHVRMVDDDK